MARRTFSLLMALTLILWAGCGTKPAVPKTAAMTLEPRDLLDKTLAVYRGAAAYEDDGIVRLSYKQDGSPLEDTAPLAVQFAAPNRLHVRAYQTEVASDGEHFHAIVKDPLTADLDGQVVKRTAPKKFTLDELYSDEVLRDALQSGLGRHPVQLELLFGEAPLVDLLKADAKIKALEPKEDATGQLCQRIEADLADGKYVFWIDNSNYLLRRIEYPVASMLPQLANLPGVTDLSLVADFRGAKIEKELPASTFAFAMPDKGHRVRYFVLPPQGLPSELFGHKPGDFSLTTVDGTALPASELAGKINVLMWFSNDPACEPGLKQLQAAMEEVKASDKVSAYVVATEDKETTNEALQAVLKNWQVELPLLRDYAFVGRDTFDIKSAPTLVVLDAEGRVQLYEEGASPRLSQSLAGALTRLLAGEDLAAELITGAKKAEEQYAQNLASASGEATQTSIIEIPEAKAVPKSAPQHFELTELWSTTDKTLAEPGNFLVIPGESQPRVLVIDGWRTIVELAADGKISQTHKLTVPENAGVTYLRTATNKAGQRWFVGSALLGQQLYVFDEQWQTKLRYPPEDQPHDGLHAVEIADLANDGTPELYVGYWSLVGVQGVTLEGVREWSNRVVPTVLSLVTTPPNELGWRKIIASGDRGVLYRMNQFGHQDPKIEIPGRQVHRLTASTFGSLASTYCGVSYQTDGRLLAVGLDADLKEVWNYKLPVGQFNNQIEYVTSGRLRSDEQGEWILAGPDGTVHVVSDNGEFSDSFATGELLTGIAFAQFGDQRVVLTSCKGKVT
ncbi:MAG TPA: redoxin domain-containing protein, partial [Pirellulaceae bacterium]|nr:redoxin domain-containing protein [Pirellulaceae bacterium]